MTQMPARVKVTVAPDMEQTEVLAGSMVNVTGLPPVAVTVYVLPTAGLVGWEVKEIA